jgi:hypothetical protein
MPCRCLGFFDRLIPNWPVFFLVVLLVCAPLWVLVTIFWWVYTPAWAEFGYPGMHLLAQRGGLIHPAQFYVSPEPHKRENLAVAVLEKKLGRAPSERVIKHCPGPPRGV